MVNTDEICLERPTSTEVDFEFYKYYNAKLSYLSYYLHPVSCLAYLPISVSIVSVAFGCDSNTSNSQII